MCEGLHDVGVSREGRRGVHFESGCVQSMKHPMLGCVGGLGGFSSMKE